MALVAVTGADLSLGIVAAGCCRSVDGGRASDERGNARNVVLDAGRQQGTIRDLAVMDAAGTTSNRKIIGVRFVRQVGITDQRCGRLSVRLSRRAYDKGQAEPTGVQHGHTIRLPGDGSAKDWIGFGGGDCK